MSHAAPLRRSADHSPPTGLTRAQLSRADPERYVRMLGSGALAAVPEDGEYADALSYYRSHYRGFTRGELWRTDPHLSSALYDQGALGAVGKVGERRRRVGGRPPGRPARWDDPVAYYRSHYAGLCRGELSKVDSSLYTALRKAGRMEVVPLADRSKSGRRPSAYADDPVAHYRGRYDGYTTARLRKVNHALFTALKRAGKLDVLPPTNRSKSAKSRSPYGEDPAGYYRAHFAGLTRSELWKAKSGLYYRLLKDGLIHVVPTEKEKEIAAFGDPVAYYETHFAGLTQAELRTARPGLYDRLKRDGKLDAVPEGTRRPQPPWDTVNRTGGDDVPCKRSSWPRVQGSVVTHRAIARAAGVDRTTVTKILNRDPNHSTTAGTRARVIEAAERLGHDFAMIRRPFYRQHPRCTVGLPCRLTVLLSEDRVFDAGTAVVVNMGLGGALLGEIELPRDGLPLERFTFLLEFPGTAELAGVAIEARLARLADSVAGRRRLAVAFEEMRGRDRAKLAAYVQTRLARVAARV